MTGQDLRREPTPTPPVLSPAAQAWVDAVTEHLTTWAGTRAQVPPEHWSTRPDEVRALNAAFATREAMADESSAALLAGVADGLTARQGSNGHAWSGGDGTDDALSRDVATALIDWAVDEHRSALDADGLLPSDPGPARAPTATAQADATRGAMLAFTADVARRAGVDAHDVRRAMFLAGAAHQWRVAAALLTSRRTAGLDNSSGAALRRRMGTALRASFPAVDADATGPQHSDPQAAIGHAISGIADPVAPGNYTRPSGPGRSKHRPTFHPVHPVHPDHPDRDVHGR